MTSVLALFVSFIPSLSAQGHLYVGGAIAANFAQFSHNAPEISYFSGTKITDDYPLASTHPEATVLSGTIGYEFRGSHWKPAVALGLGVYGNLADYTFKGSVTETAAEDPGTRLYKYNYHLTSMRLMAEMQLNWTLTQLSPFVNFGLGSAWSNLTGYNETAINPVGYPPLLPFRSQNTLNVAFQIGCGVSTSFNVANSHSDFLHERISVGYRYVNLGSTSFGTRGPQYPFKLNPGLLQTNEIYFGYTHLF